MSSAGKMQTVGRVLLVCAILVGVIYSAISRAGTSAAQSVSKIAPGPVGTVQVSRNGSSVIYNNCQDCTVTTQNGTTTITRPDGTTTTVANTGQVTNSTTTTVTSNGFVTTSNSIQPNGQMQTKTRTCPSFNSVVSDTSCDITIVCGKPQNVQVTASANVLPTIHTDVENGTLHIYDTANAISSGNQKVTICAPDISSIDGNGSGDFKLSNVNNSNMTINLVGSGDVDVQGQTKVLSATISGSGNITATNLRAQSSTATISGSGDIDLNAQQSLNATVSGSGDIHYTGQPAIVHTQLTGSGDIRSS